MKKTWFGLRAECRHPFFRKSVLRHLREHWQINGFAFVVPCENRFTKSAVLSLFVWLPFISYDFYGHRVWGCFLFWFCPVSQKRRRLFLFVFQYLIFFSYLQKLAHFNIEMKGTSDKMLWWCEVKCNNSDCSRRNLLSPQRQAQSENTLIKIWVGRENCAIPYCVEYGWKIHTLWNCPELLINF